MINSVVLVGRLTRDSETRGQICVFTIAIDNYGKDKDGKKTTSFIPCVVLNPQRAESAAKNALKGRLVGVEGRLNQRSFVKLDQTKGSTLEVIVDNIVYLDKRVEQVENEEQDIPPFDDFGSSNDEEDSSSDNLDGIEITNDDLPF